MNISIVQLGESFDLRINSCPFSHIRERLRNKLYFGTKEESCHVVLAENSKVKEKDTGISTGAYNKNELNNNNQFSEFNFKIKPKDPNSKANETLFQFKDNKQEIKLINFECDSLTKMKTNEPKQNENNNQTLEEIFNFEKDYPTTPSTKDINTNSNPSYPTL